MFANIFKSAKDKYKNYQYAKMMNGYTPIFSQFGEDIYASDVVNSCIRCIATDISKLEPKHIRTDSNDMKITVKSNINRLLYISPNPYMTINEYLEKIIWLLYKNKNVFIYPTYNEVPIGNGLVKRDYTGLYPLDPVIAEFLEDITGKIFLKLTFKNGKDYTAPYEDFIHIKKDFSFNDLMGGDENGQAKNEDLLKILKVDHTIVQGLDKAVKTSLSVKGLFKIQTLLDDEKQEQKRKEFEVALQRGDTATLATDLKTEFIPININPAIIDKNTLEFVQLRILNTYGVSLPIFNGDFTDEQYQAFYEKTLEAIIIALGKAHSKTLFTQRELDIGNEVIFYPQKLLFTNTKNRIAVADILGNRGALTDNQLLDLFGYPPFEGGDVRHMSLNFINRDIADNYQMQSVKAKEVK